MKKLLLGGMAMMLAACGTTTDVQTATQTGGRTAALKVVLNDTTAKRTERPTTATKVRFVITNPTLTINGERYNSLNTTDQSDYDIVGGTATGSFSLPVANGYVLEAIKYVQANGVNKIVAYGKTTGINVTAGGSTTGISVSDLTVKVAFGMYSTPAGGTSTWFPQSSAVSSTNQIRNVYGIGVNPATPLPSVGLDPAFKHATQYTAFAQYTSINEAYRPLSGYTSTTFRRQKTPETLTDRTMFAMAEFYLSPSLRKTGDPLFVYAYPDPGVRGETYTADGTISIPLAKVPQFTNTFSF